MYNVTLLQYDLLSKTTIQKQLNGGTFLKEIIVNALKYIQGNITEDRKILMYSGDDRNIVGILKAMNLWSPHIPTEATSLIFELYFNNVTSKYGIKVRIFCLFNILYYILNKKFSNQFEHENNFKITELY